MGQKIAQLRRRLDLVYDAHGVCKIYSATPFIAYIKIFETRNFLLKLEVLFLISI